MGAAAAVLSQPRRPVGRAASAGDAAASGDQVPSWMDKKSKDFIAWTAIPNSFFESACRKLSFLESTVLGLISRYTYGDIAKGRPVWLELSLVKFAGLTGAHRNGIAIALDRLERAGAIESERVGRGKRYRVAIHNLGSLKELPPETQDADTSDDDESPDSEASDNSGSAAPQPVIRMGKHSVPLSSIPFCTDCAAKVIAAVQSNAQAPKGENTANNHHSECANQPEKGENMANDHHSECASASPSVNLGFSSSICLDEEQLYAFLSKDFAKKLGEPPPRHLVAKAVAELDRAGVPLSDLLRKIDARRSIFRFGLLGNLTADVINAHAAATRHLPKQPTATEKEAQMQQHVLSTTEKIRAHAAGLIAKIKSVPGVEKAVEALEHVNVNARSYYDDWPKLQQVLESAQWIAVDALAAARLTAQQRKQVDRQISEALKPHRQKMTETQLDELTAQLRSRLVLQELGMPSFLEVVI